MKKFCCLIITLLILITSIGCNNSTQKENKESLTASGYILDIWKKNDNIDYILFYDYNNDKFMKFTVPNANIAKEQGFTKGYLIGCNLSKNIKLTYLHKDNEYITTDIDFADNELPCFTLPNDKHNSLYYLTQFWKEDYSKEESIDFTKAVIFFMNYNAAHEYKLLDATETISDKGTSLHEYDMDLFLQKTKSIFPNLDISQTDALLDNNIVKLNYIESSNIIQCHDMDVLSGACHITFVKEHMKINKTNFKTHTLVVDDNHIPYEIIYQYQLNNKDNLQLLSVQKFKRNI